MDETPRRRGSTSNPVFADAANAPVSDARTLTNDVSPGFFATLGVQPLRSIKEDTEVTLGFQGLTGVGYVEMAGGSPELNLAVIAAG